jgi:LmbE family N-acetylglucosaminyl deacetylase
VVAHRRAEDHAALTVLDAEPLWLDFPDTQYAPQPAKDVLAVTIERALEAASADLVVIPLGLFHSDHLLTHTACLKVLWRRPDLTWMVYADAIYRRRANLVHERLEELQRAGLSTAVIDPRLEAGSELKRHAVECYASQLRALALSWENGYADAFEPERYWSLASSPGSVGPPRAAWPPDDR